ncbi:MAG: hypothetical protein NZ899_13775 [Thermoguttaceae bacterium]|nr:hypothetical protein [Thermoguttaceae bacterium]MDW8080011.1 hypothetical protein [Thermoguttaceae bacterium]
MLQALWPAVGWVARWAMLARDSWLVSVGLRSGAEPVRAVDLMDLYHPHRDKRQYRDTRDNLDILAASAVPERAQRVPILVIRTRSRNRWPTILPQVRAMRISDWQRRL